MSLLYELLLSEGRKMRAILFRFSKAFGLWVRMKTLPAGAGISGAFRFVLLYVCYVVAPFCVNQSDQSIVFIACCLCCEERSEQI